MQNFTMKYYLEIQKKYINTFVFTIINTKNI